MAKNININIAHVESYSVCECHVLEKFKYISEHVSRWFSFMSYDEYFEYVSLRYSREQINRMEGLYTQAKQVFEKSKIVLTMVSGQKHVLYFDSMEDLNFELGIIKSGRPDYVWKKI